jgi:hypothetical protein
MEHQQEHQYTQQFQQFVRIMQIIQAQQIVDSLKDAQQFYIQHATAHKNYAETCELFHKVLHNLNEAMDYQKTQLVLHSDKLNKDLQVKNLEERLRFIYSNTYNDLELQHLRNMIQNNTAHNIPALELFPGTGQFLPYAVASEPLYVVDKFMEVCDLAATSLANDFYATRRLRKYTATVDHLPLAADSIGFAYCFNEFFLANEDYILSWAEQIHGKLYAGGKFLFNFLPDDQTWAQEQCLLYNFSVVSVEVLIQGLQQQGYTVQNCEILPLRRSTITAVKNGQNQDRIKQNAIVAEIIDI